MVHKIIVIGVGDMISELQIIVIGVDEKINEGTGSRYLHRDRRDVGTDYLHIGTG